MNYEELYHHGILGMKWGKRNGPPYPLNESAKSAAEKKQQRKSDTSNMSDDELKKRVQRLNLEKSYKNLSKSSNQSSKLDKAKKIVDSSSSLVNQAKKMHQESINKSTKREVLDLSKMTDKELQERINRYNLERRYNDIFAKETTNVSRGREYLSDILDIGGSALAVGSSALAIALAIKELKH